MLQKILWILHTWILTAAVLAASDSSARPGGHVVDHSIHENTDVYSITPGNHVLELIFVSRARNQVVCNRLDY